MERKPQLYYKENGRYREYHDPLPPFNNALYRKIVHGKKTYYEPVSMLQTRDLDEGVWVVTKNCYGKSYSNGKYLNDCFMCLKASDIQEVSLAKLGGMDKLANYLCSNWDRLPKNKSIAEICRSIVGILFEYETKGK